ncbi:MAG: phenylalanine--tRNA ligase beta subunit-related protein [Candidatus Burarchaeum sp.]|nr:phenylalanine--tRNA ligase beta subunit-related protein [Candidatus Burarchaeum sp.]MDO8339430.1 phenylalanine--tRNA ligase beta subunit-related protein [Candidatus Burarchaeum sp.]
MKFKIDGRIFEKFPGLCIGVVVAKGLDNAGVPEGIEAQLREQEAQIRAKLNAETLSQEPKIACWRAAYSAFGGKPKENRSSVENLYKLVLKGGEVRHINKLVDLYNLVSLKHMVPVGGEDTDKISGDIELTFVGPTEPPALMLGDKEPRPPHEGEVIYKDAVGAICRRWNWREADRTKLTEETKNCILVVEGLPPVTRAEVEAATGELKELVQRICGGSAVQALLDEANSEIEL